MDSNPFYLICKDGASYSLTVIISRGNIFYKSSQRTKHRLTWGIRTKEGRICQLRNSLKKWGVGWPTPLYSVCWWLSYLGEAGSSAQTEGGGGGHPPPRDSALLHRLRFYLALSRTAYILIQRVLNAFVTRKNLLSRIFAKIQPQNYRFSGISNPQRFLRYLF